MSRLNKNISLKRKYFGLSLIFIATVLTSSCSYLGNDSLSEDDILEAMQFYNSIKLQGTDYKNVNLDKCVFRNQFGEESKEVAPSFDFWACNYSVDAKMDSVNKDWETIDLTGIFKRSDPNLHLKSAGYTGKVVIAKVGKQVSLDIF